MAGGTIQFLMQLIPTAYTLSKKIETSVYTLEIGIHRKAQTHSSVGIFITAGATPKDHGCYI